MAMQRQVSPIPPGRYWIVVDSPEKIADFDAWIKDMAGGVRVETTSIDKRGSATSQFIIFNVPEGRSPFLNAAEFGFPNTAGPNVQSREDAASDRPDPVPDPLDRIPDPLDAAKGLVADAEIAFLLILAFLFFSKR
jgi:hypothetical protein